ncbi:MAG: carboxylating nicotinate-nucleotide diphosphorylase [Acidobacteria bacterium]|nr:carboxylating nicotinate-nucleotide diphosphorylase [Acidobacteriota bacterium]
MSSLVTVAKLPPSAYEEIVRLALAEDLGRAGDLTGGAVIALGTRCTAHVVARQDGRLAGVPLAQYVFRALDPGLETLPILEDGQDFRAGDTILEIRGCGRPILAAERTALNFLGHLSGIATLTREFARRVAGTGVRIVDTRKTLPGLRALEKYAVRCGGGWNHRFALDDGILIKDNHITLAGGVAEAIRRARLRAGHMVRLEVEVDTLEQLEEALEAGVDAVLLDNMDLETLRKAVEIVDGRATTEASGGVVLERVREIAGTGVDLISVGTLTHSAPAVDLSLEIG